MGSLPSVRCRLLAFAVLAQACHPSETPGVPLYPNGATTRLPRAQIAQVYGPIEKVDGQDVQGQGGVFDLLAGCHIVELERRMVADGYALSGGTYWTGSFPMTVYALRMKAGARYVIRRELSADGLGRTGRVILSAREEEPSGAAADLSPATSLEEVEACKQWAAASPAP
jgi:hypothetical protein